MLGYVGLIALFMFAWQAWRIATRPAPPANAEQVQSPDDVDFSVDEEGPPRLKDDEIRIIPRRPRVDAEPRVDAAERIAIPKSWLAEVADNTVGVRQHEADAYYRILAKAADISPRRMRSEAEPGLQYVNMMTSPEKYRGRPVTIKGDLWKLYEFQAPRNDYGISRLYEAWIFTADSGNHPYRVICTEIPPEIKPQDDSRRSVTVTGYFFKREGYETSGGRLHVAPTLLAGRLELYISPEAPPPVEDLVPWMVAIISVVGLAMLATVVGFAVSDSRSRRSRDVGGTNQSLDTAALLQADRRLSIEESLRQLEEGDYEQETNGHQRNGDSHLGNGEESPEETIDLPTPFPPTRVPRRWDESPS